MYGILLVSLVLQLSLWGITDACVCAAKELVCEATKESIWLKKFYTSLEVIPNMDKALTLYYDNSRAVTNSKEPRSHKMGKHIEKKYHLIREIMHRGDVNVVKIALEDNLVDLFTKTLP